MANLLSGTVQCKSKMTLNKKSKTEEKCLKKKMLFKKNTKKKTIKKNYIDTL